MEEKKPNFKMRQRTHDKKCTERFWKTALFNFEGSAMNLHKGIKVAKGLTPWLWGCSSAGRAPALQAGGQEFDSPHLHQSPER